MESWPSSFPFPTVGLVGKADPNVIRTPMESGYVRQRLRFTKQLFTLDVSWELSAFEYEVFTAFHKHRLNMGTDWFLIYLPLGDTVQEFQVRFKGGEYKHAYRLVNYWEISAALELHTRHTMDADVLTALVDIGFSDAEIQLLLLAIDDFHKAVHVTLPFNHS